MSNKNKTISKEAQAIANVFQSHPGEKMTWAQACELAGVPAKTGYLASVKSILGADNLAIGEKDLEVEVLTKVKRNSYTYTPNC